MNESTRVISKQPRYPLWVIERRFTEARRRWVTADKLAQEAKAEFDRVSAMLKREREAQREVL